jgi:hypothetical protein
MFREMCLPEKTAMRIKKVESITAVWAMLHVF